LTVAHHGEARPENENAIVMVTKEIDMPNLFARVAVLLLLLLPLAGFAAPRIFYTDIISGPNSGGENGNGTYLSIFGTGFGPDISLVTVTVGAGAVPRKMFLGTSNGRSDVQQLSVQLGPANTTGPIKVTVGGIDSNTDQTFTVTTGAITLCTTVTCVNNTLAGASPGATVAIRGGTYTAEIYFHNVSGAAGLPLMVLGYPGENVNFSISGGGGNCVHTFYQGANGTQGHYVVAGINCDMNGAGGSVIGMGVDLTDVRVVNNVACCMFENSGGSAAISGSGTNFKVLGNHVRDNGGSKLYHGLYFDGRAATSDNYEIAYNHIHNQTGGRGIQIFGDAGRTITNVRVHHNLIHNIHLDGILFGDQTGTGFQAYNNVVYQVADPAMQGPTTDAGVGGGCIRFNGLALVALVYNNTFVDCAKDNDASNSEGIRFQAANTITLRNNIVASGIVVPSGAAPYARIESAMTITSSNNLWFGAGAAPSFDTSRQITDPLFVSALVANFRVLAGSPAIDNGSTSVNALVTSDFDGNARPQGSAPDIGAFESTGITLPTPQNLRITP
jgi:hypothetical protein